MSVAAERRRIASTWNGKIGRLTQRRSVGHGQGMIGQQMRQPQRRNAYAPRVKMTDDARALQTLETAQRRADAYKVQRAREAALEATDDSLFDQCMHGHNTMPPVMAWPEMHDPWMMNWEVYEAQWTYDRSMRLYVRD